MTIRCILSLTMQVIHIIISQLEEVPVSSNPHTIGLELLGGEINRKSRDSCTQMQFNCSVCRPCGRLKTRLKVMRMRAGGGQKRRPGHYCLTHLAHIRIMLTVEKTTGRNDWKIILARQISRGWRNWKRSMIRLAHSPETISDFDIEFITLF